MSNLQSNTAATTASPPSPALLIHILKLLGLRCQRPDQNLPVGDAEDALLFVARIISEATGTKWKRTATAAIRLGNNGWLEPSIPEGDSTPESDLSDVAEACHQLDLMGCTQGIWSRVCSKWPGVCHAYHEALRLRNDAGPGNNLPSAPASNNKSAEPTKNITWQEVAKNLNRLREQGEPWTSHGDMAQRFDCSQATVHKAVKNTPELQPWAKQPDAPPRAQSLNPVVTDNTEQDCELDPSEEIIIREFVEHADPDEKAFIHEISDAPRDYQLWYIRQPHEAQKIHRKAWTKLIGSDATNKVWFNALKLEDKLEYLDDPNRYPTILGRKP